MREVGAVLERHPIQKLILGLSLLMPTALPFFPAISDLPTPG
jgi:hypothetical protein